MKRLHRYLFIVILSICILPFSAFASAASGITPEKSNYYFIFNSSKVDSKDLTAIKGFTAKFKNTKNIMFDAKGYGDATKLYDALKAYQKKVGGKVAGIQIFGLAGDVPSFSYIYKLKFSKGNAEWNGVEQDKENKYVSDYLYSNFKNDSKYLKEVSVYGIVQDKLPINMIPEWPVSRLPLTKGEIAKYIGNYDAYRKQTDGKSVPTVAASFPYQIQDKLAQDDIAFFTKRLKEDEEFGLFKETEQRAYYKDFSANITKENKAGVTDLIVGGRGDANGATDGKNPFFDRKSVVGLNANYYTAFLWGFDGASGLDTESVVHDGLAKGKMISAIAHTIPTVNRGAFNYLNIPNFTPKDGKYVNGYVVVDKEHLEWDNPFFFVYKYYEAINGGKTRLQSFFEAKSAYATLTVANKNTFRKLSGFEALYSANSFQDLFSMHYLGLADY